MAEVKAKHWQWEGLRGDNSGRRLEKVIFGRWANNDTLKFYNARDVVWLGGVTNQGRSPNFDNKVIDAVNKTVTFTFNGAPANSGENIVIGAALIIQESS